MPSEALLLTEADLQPLTTSASAIDGAIAAVERALRDLHQGDVTQATFLGHRQPSGRPSTRITLATGAGWATGIRSFGTPAPDYLGVPRTANSRCFVLLDGETGQLLSLMDYARLNPIRVGAVGGVAARLLAPPSSATLAVIGSGHQARAQMQAICRAVPGIQQVRVYSPTPAHREAFASEMAAWLDVPTEAATSATEAARGADIVTLATSSNRPVIDWADVKPGAVVISMTEGQLAPDFVDRSRLVFLTWDAIADNILPREPYTSRINAGTFTRADLGAELTAVAAGAAPVPRRSPTDIVAFELTALAALDLAVAQWAHAWARETHVGTPFVLSPG